MQRAWKSFFEYWIKNRTWTLGLWGGVEKVGKLVIEVASSSLSVPDARKDIWAFSGGKVLLWNDMTASPFPQYLIDNTDRILAVSFKNSVCNEAFSGTIIDRIPACAMYEENHAAMMYIAVIFILSRGSCHSGTIPRDPASKTCWVWRRAQAI